MLSVLVHSCHILVNRSMRKMELGIVLTVFYVVGFRITLCKALDDSTLCPESNTTINFVTSCPLSENEWLIAASKMNCQSIENNCASFVYHCVMDSNMTRMIEVCGPVTIIVGKTCTEYNVQGGVIQRNRFANCSLCPAFYFSNETFEYIECYKLVNTSDTGSPTSMNMETTTYRIKPSPENSNSFTTQTTDQLSINTTKNTTTTPYLPSFPEQGKSIPSEVIILLLSIGITNLGIASVLVFLYPKMMRDVRDYEDIRG